MKKALLRKAFALLLLIVVCIFVFYPANDPNADHKSQVYQLVQKVYKSPVDLKVGDKMVFPEHLLMKFKKDGLLSRVVEPFGILDIIEIGPETVYTKYTPLFIKEDQFRRDSFNLELDRSLFCYLSLLTHQYFGKLSERQIDSQIQKHIAEKTN